MVKFYMQPDKKRLWRAGARWAVLALLLGGVGALAIWGSEDDTGGVGGAQALLQAQLAAQQAAADQDDTPQDDILPVSGGDIAAQSGSPQNDVQNGRQADKAEDKPPQQPDSDGQSDEQDIGQEVRDDAPEPWVGDAALTAEAELMTMLQPLEGTPSRGYGFGYDATFADYRFHQGVDWQVAAGTVVQAPLAGTVTLLDDPFYGSGIELVHQGQLVSLYYGITPAEGLSSGAEVQPGETLGKVCESPVFEDGQPPHLHWELWLDGEPIDPIGAASR